MAIVKWNTPGVGGSWTDKSNWAGDALPGLTDTASLPADAKPYIVTLNHSESVGAVTIGKGATLDILSGHKLTTSDTITVSAGGVIEGVGVVDAKGGFLGSGTIEAGSGELKINGTLADTMHLVVGGVSSDLVVVDAISEAHVDLSGGTLTDKKGISLGGGKITGDGTITTGNGAANDLSGSGKVTASGGTLTFTDAVDKGGSGGATTFDIDSSATLAFDSSVGNLTTPLDPKIDFSGTDATLDLTGETTNEKSEFYGVVSNFAAGDQILVQGSGDLGDKAVFNSSDNTLEIENSGGKILDEILFKAGSISGNPFQVTENGGTDKITICFLAGTRIRTPDGEVAVETLKPGDPVMTADGRSIAVNWLGKQTISMRFANPQRVLPIRVRAGALAENVPLRDLLLSPDHALWIDGALVQAGALVNGRSIVQETRVPAVFTYYHVETDDHSLILAEGAPAETFVDTVDRLNFDNWAEYQALYPDGKTVDELPYPRAKAHRQVPVRVRVRLAERASIIGEATEKVA